MEEVRKAAKEVKLSIDAMNFLFNAKVRESKQLQNFERYRKAKVLGKLLAGGFNKQLAKHMSGHVLTPELDGFVIDEAAWQPTSIQKWTSWRQPQASPLEQTVHKFINVDSAERMALLEDSMEQRPDWKGCMTSLTCPAIVETESEALNCAGPDPVHRSRRRQ